MNPRRTRLVVLTAVPILVAGGASVGWAAGSAEPPVAVREPLARPPTGATCPS